MVQEGSGAAGREGKAHAEATEEEPKHQVLVCKWAWGQCSEESADGDQRPRMTPRSSRPSGSGGASLSFGDP